MKNFFFSLVLLITIGGSLYAQTPKKPEKKVYKAEDEKLYINKDLGVYLWLSTSPEPEADKIRLKSDTSAKYSNPMFFDTEGYNTVRSPSAVDTTTKKVVYPLHDIIFEVYADGIPPKTHSSYSYDKTQLLNGKRYYGGALKVELNSTDQVSGVESVFFSLNNDLFSVYDGPVDIAKQGENKLTFYSVDKVGNREDPAEEVFYWDNTPPETRYEIIGDQNDKYISQQAKIKLISTDKLSGVKTIYYQINQSSFLPYKSPVPATLLSGDNASLSFYAIDYLGNREPVQTIGSANGISVEDNESTPSNVVFEFYIDKEAPTIELELKGEQSSGKYTYISPRTQFILRAEDDKAGVKQINYSINSTSLDHVYKEPFSLEETGLKYLHFTATDYVGNTSAKKVKAFYCDAEEPVTTLKVGSPKFNSRDTLFITSQTLIHLAATDAHAGINTIAYQLNDQNKQDYADAFSVNNTGLVSLTYNATDKVGNEEKINRQTLFVDNEPPTIHYHFSVESIGSKVVREETYTIYPTNMMLYIAATDSRSGGEKIEYRLNGGTILSDNPIKGLAPGNYLVEVFAYDVLGNKSEKAIKFAIEE